MVRINCHSAFKHYEMFHTSCSGGSNYGSVFNTTYNINCGGHGGGFWGGFGAGLGNAFGSIFGGMFGGGMSNFGFGNFGMGGFGMGGFGMGGLTMPWFNSMGNFGWGGGNVGGASGTNSNNSSNSSNGTVDKDNALYNTYKKEVDNAIKDNDAKIAKDLYDKIKKSHEKPEDPLNENMNKGAYHDLMTTLENKFPELKDGADAGKDKKTPSTSTDGESKVNPSTDGTNPVQDTTDTTGDIQQAAKDNAEKLKNAGNLEDLLGVNYDSLSYDDKQKYLESAKKFAKEVGETPEELAKFRDSLSKLPKDVRMAVKQSFYEKGYSNINESEITAELLSKLQNVIDASEVPDFKNVTLGTPKKDSNSKWTIPVKTYKDEAGKAHNLGVSYVQVEVIDGEVIFHGKQLTQKYVLQTDGKDLHLMQYKYHEGYGKGDVVRNQ